MCCEPFVSGDRQAVPHHCTWSPFCLEETHTELISPQRRVMERGLTVFCQAFDGVIDSERHKEWGVSALRIQMETLSSEERRAEPRRPSWPWNPITVMTLIRATEHRSWVECDLNDLKWSSIMMHRLMYMQVIQRWLQAATIKHRSSATWYRTPNARRGESYISAQISKVTNPFTGTVQSRGHAEGDCNIHSWKGQI